MTTAHIRRALSACAAIGMLAGCGGGILNALVSTSVPSFPTIVPAASAPHAAGVPKKVVVTVRWLFSNDTVAGASVALGWGKACGKFHCSTYQRRGKTGGKGRIAFMNVPPGNTNWCAIAAKGNSSGANCYTGNSHPIDSEIPVHMPRT